MKTKDDIRVLMDSIFKQLQETREAGQKEYAHSSENAFGNFERLSKQLDLSRERVLWVYVQKHIDGVVSYLNGHQSQREDVRGRIKDIIVYLILLWGMVDDNEVNQGKAAMDEAINAYAEQNKSLRNLDAWRPDHPDK
jgi:protoporphyrinogen oxidase